jgi:DNA polymerase
MPQRRLHLDYETFSRAELKDVGAWRYAQDSTTEIICAAMALDDLPPLVWYADMPYHELMLLDPFFDALEDPDVLVFAFNAGFEIAISQALMWKTWGINPPAIERWRCARSMALRAALPGSLDKLGEVLELTTQKDKRGKALIKKFCVMQKAKAATLKKPAMPVHRIYPQDDPQAFAEFLQYCKTDVIVEREATKMLSYFDEPINNANYTLHEVINARGVAVNLVALRHAQRLIEEESELVGQRFRELVGFEYTQNAVLLNWANTNGDNYTFENLQAETIDTFLDQWEGIEQVPITVEALRLKQSVAYVSIKKVQTMLACAGPADNRIRGMLNHHGATTGRSTNSLVQFQNMKRPTIKDSEGAYQMICEGCSREMLEICYGPVLEVISSCVRHFVEDTESTDSFPREEYGFSQTPNQ